MLSMRKSREEGRAAAAGPQGERAREGTRWPGLVTSIVLTETLPALAKPDRHNKTQVSRPGKPGAAWVSLTQALGLGLAWGQPVTVWLGTRW